MDIKVDHFIGGKTVTPSSGKYLDDYNPATGGVIGQVAAGNAQDVDAAVKSAKAAFPAWRDLRPIERGRILIKIAAKIREKTESLGVLDRLETGKAAFQVPGEMETAAFFWEFYGGIVFGLHADTIELGAGLHSYTRREPFGVVAVIPPWNGPLISSTRGAAPALAVGNTIVVKPSSHTAASITELARLAFEECGLPAGVFNVVSGAGSTVGSALVSHSDIRKVTLTGSTGVGREIGRIAAERIIPVNLELGGKSPTLVFDDADLQKAAYNCVLGFSMNAGQICYAGTRILVQQTIHDQFVEEMVKVVKQLKVGADDTCSIGAIITHDQYETVQEYLKIAESEGAVAAVGGVAANDPKQVKGWFIQPTLYTKVNNKMRIAQEEIFGPVACVIPFKDEEEAVAMANDSAYGLSSVIWTRDLSRAHRVAARLEAGQVNVNDFFASQLECPMGGYKESGYGREKGAEALRYFTQVKCVNIRL